MKNDLAPKTMQAGLTGRKLSRDRKKIQSFAKITIEGIDVPFLQYLTFHEQKECVHDFPSISLATCASADVSELVQTGVLKNSSDTPAEAHMAKDCDENHTHTPAVHGK